MSKLTLFITKKQSIKKLIINNSKVVENYFFMTALQLISSFFGILIYPYLIRVLGAESYGLYVFALSITSYFTVLISFGFYFPALKGVVENIDNQKIKNDIVSSVFTAKCYLFIISTILFTVLLLLVPAFHNNWLIFILSFSQIIAEILFPIWYFQGIQKMRIVTFIQLGFRILSLPFIFIFIKKPEDCWIYVLISSFSVIFGGFTSMFILNRKEHVVFQFVSIHSLKIYFREAMPFFWSASAGIIKQESVTIIIGTFFGMKDVALYDLANKIIILPRLLTMSINGALLPKLIDKVNKKVVIKIIRYETLIGFSIILGIILFGRWIVLLFGGISMLGSYPLAIILSITVLVWLVVGCYISFIFLPSKRYYFVSQNQLVAFGTFFLFCIPGLLVYHSIFAVVIALTLSGLSEIIYCSYLIKKHNLL